MRRLRPTAGLGLAALAVLVLPAGAGAATTVGSNLAAAPAETLATDSSGVQRTQATGVTMPLTAPAAGVIVQILVKHGGSGANPGTWGFRVLSGSPTLYSTVGIPAELPDFAWPANDPAGTRPFTPSLAGVPKGIPIGAGDRLGMVRQAGGVPLDGPLVFANPSPGATADSRAGAHNSGSADYGSPLPNIELLTQFRVEPDADRDGFGDESQDRCPTNAATQGACPVPVKRCKKKRKRKKSAEGAKKKKKKRGCKKNRKKKRR